MIDTIYSTKLMIPIGYSKSHDDLIWLCLREDSLSESSM